MTTGVEPMERLTMDMPEACRLLGISVPNGYRLAAAGELPGCRRLGHRYVISRAALLRFIEKGEA